jgi:hypothetical protein
MNQGTLIAMFDELHKIAQATAVKVPIPRPASITTKMKIPEPKIPETKANYTMPTQAATPMGDYKVSPTPPPVLA